MYQFLEQTAKEAPNNLFLIRENITYTGFLPMVHARATTLHNAGIKAGDVVGVLSHNIPQFPLTLFAIWYLGARVLMLDTNLTSFEYENMTKITNCKHVCAEKSFFYESKNVKFIDIEVADTETNKDLQAADTQIDEIATMSFTSGSTGVSKVVPLTHSNLIEAANAMSDFNIWIHNGEVMYGFLPLYHIFGFAIGILAPLHYKMGVVLQPTVNPKAILDDFKTFRPHVIPAVPRLWEIFRNKMIAGVKEKKKWWLASFVLKNRKFLKAIGLKGLVSKVQKPLLSVFGGRANLLIAGGAATKPEVEKFYESLGLTFIQGYGMTETVGPICCSHPVKKRVPFSVGGPMGCNECEIRNKDEKGIGTLWVRGPQVFNGYVNNPSMNEESFDKNGFFNTGDMVYMDKNGELHFAGRKKQVIVLDSGKNVYPDELEALFMEIDGVKNVAVFEHKVKDKTVAYGVFSVEKNMTMSKLALYVALANKNLAPYKWVTHFAMTTEDLPTTSTGKVKHYLVRQNLIDGKYTNKHE
ncbi:MAG: AMP-binding protein [Alphaproteobacteria bacterium]|nr:AMP-binding protein [Alphaproteobacteria bacterium]